MSTDCIYRISTIKDCEEFKLFSCLNRGIREDLVKKYEKMYLDGKNLGPMIVERKTKGILDAQHRFEAWKRAREKKEDIPTLPVLYYEDLWGELNTDEERKEAIQGLNSGVHWNMNDFITSNMSGDNELSKLEKFCLEHNRLHRVVKSGKNKGKKSALFRRGAAIVSGDPKYYRKALRGDFRASKEQWEEAEDVYNEIENFLVAMKLSNQTDIPALEGIINGWQDVRNDRRYLKKIDKLPNGIEDLYKYAGEMDLRHTTSKDEWANRFGSLVDCVYAKIA